MLSVHLLRHFYAGLQRKTRSSFWSEKPYFEVLPQIGSEENRCLALPVGAQPKNIQSFVLK
jgi:hypothetical protein